MTHRTTETIEAPNDEGITLSQHVQALAEAWTIVPCPRGFYRFFRGLPLPVVVLRVCRRRRLRPFHGERGSGSRKPTLLWGDSALPVKSEFPTSHGYLAPMQYRFPLPRMNMVSPAKAGVVTDSSPSFESATETNAFDARKTCIVPPLSMA